MLPASFASSMKLLMLTDFLNPGAFWVCIKILLILLVVGLLLPFSSCCSLFRLRSWDPKEFVASGRYLEFSWEACLVCGWLCFFAV